MNVASLELCQELGEASGWTDTSHIWMTHRTLFAPVVIAQPDGPEDDVTDYPAYDLGYLLRKLPVGVSLYKGAKGYTFNVGNSIQHSVEVYEVIRSKNLRSDTPEDAAAKLAIELLKQGVLTKEAGDVS